MQHAPLGAPSGKAKDSPISHASCSIIDSPNLNTSPWAAIQSASSPAEVLVDNVKASKQVADTEHGKEVCSGLDTHDKQAPSTSEHTHVDISIVECFQDQSTMQTLSIPAIAVQEIGFSNASVSIMEDIAPVLMQPSSDTFQ
ncbi:hypothetical protein ACH5RR_023079 [Cinchona calisaya]|uniref:Uncharacterized protein n=1 Tax=Cinchona calisaya TaxID=153742 RepID=A0ABD2Z9M2_9GENT